MGAGGKFDYLFLKESVYAGSNIWEFPAQWEQNCKKYHCIYLKSIQKYTLGDTFATKLSFLFFKK